jgi:hypothetical protein
LAPKEGEYVEILYNDYDFSAAFAIASLLALLALVTLALKYLVGRRIASWTSAAAAPAAVEQVAARVSNFGAFTKPSARSSRSTASTSKLRMANWSRCWDSRGPARPHFYALSADLKLRAVERCSFSGTTLAR